MKQQPFSIYCEKFRLVVHKILRNLGLVRGECDPVWRSFQGTSFVESLERLRSFPARREPSCRCADDTGAAGALGTRTLVVFEMSLVNCCRSADRIKTGSKLQHSK